MKRYIILFLLMGGLLNFSTAQTQIHFNYTIPPIPVVNAGSDTIVNANTPFTLHGSVTGGTAPFAYLWEPGSYLDNNTLINPIANLPFQNPVTFTFEVRDSNGCISNDQVEITILSGLDEMLATSHPLHLFPNPNRGIFTLKGAGSNPSGISVECYNIFGRLLNRISIPDAIDPVEISIPDLTPGIYLLQVSHASGVSLLQLIIQ